MRIETPRLILRPWEESDAQDLYTYASAPEVGPAAGWPAHTSVDQSRQVIREVLSAPQTYALVLKETGRSVGSVGLMERDLPEGEMELGYWIGVPYWGQGLIPEAAAALLYFGFQVLDLEKVWCGYYEGNEKSRRVQEKLGFRYQFTRENAPCSMLEEVRTEHFSCLTRSDWEDLHGTGI
ncbi:MAG: GNAT family N-acetyltransferase [Faecousia sp.]